MPLEEKLLVYLDGSEGTYTASQYAIYLAKKYGIELLSVYAINNKAIEELAHNHILLPQEKEEYLEDLKKDAQKHARQFERLANEKNVAVETITLSDSHDIHKSIIALIKSRTITHLILGEIESLAARQEASEAHQLVYSVHCCVTIVKDSFRVEKLFDSV
ncbi:MAG: universal stress protein [Spirochaetia bacterium]